jgi:putative transposase
MVRHPREYSWSSYRAHALGAADVVVSIHPLYRTLASAVVERQRAHRALFRPSLDAGFVDALRAATNGD